MKKTRSNSKGLRIACAIMALTLTAIVTLGVLQFATPYKPFPEKWFGQSGGEDEGKDLTSGVVVTPESGAEIELMTARSEADGEITVTATVLLENGEVAPEGRNGVRFGFAWSQEQAEPLEQYLVWTLSGNTVTLICKKAFNTQIILTCTSESDPSKSTTAKIDYACREYEIDVFPVMEEGEGSGKTDLTMDDAGTPYYQVSYNFYTQNGIRWMEKLVPDDQSGTIPNELESLTIKVEAAPELTGYLHRYGALSEEKSPRVYTKEFAGSSIERLEDNAYQVIGSESMSFQDLEFINLMTDNESTEGIDGDYYEKFKRAVLDCSFNHDTNSGCDFWVKITAHWKYGGDRDYRYNIDFVDTTPIGSVVPDKPNIIF